MYFRGRSPGGTSTTSLRYVTRKRINNGHSNHARDTSRFLTDRHWTVVCNLKLRRGLLIVQLKASSILVQFIENNRNKVGATFDTATRSCSFTKATPIKFIVSRYPPASCRMTRSLFRYLFVAR